MAQGTTGLNERFEHMGLMDSTMDDFDVEDSWFFADYDIDDTRDLASDLDKPLKDPFSDHDTKYRFDTYSVAMGNMDGKQLQFDESLDSSQLAIEGDKKFTHRQGTGQDFVDLDPSGDERAGEAMAGPASMWAEQDTLKVGQYLA
ncbi:hypothetical protein QFC19_000793 [Naganishia cerealis]|uniref:Uncharacterized protein n=1 Tax=Naganishia cerealis TaxID=610337 RepID=A0ACC2WL59_9TREE|nr:hypothetical protein QFC19_000793 [Naganishia cerealis]